LTIDLNPNIYVKTPILQGVQRLLLADVDKTG